MKKLHLVVPLALVLAFAPQAAAATCASASLSSGAPAIAAAPRPATRATLSAAMCAALRGAHDPHLATLRAGAPAAAHPLSASQRSGLQRAMAHAGGLSALRAGDLNLSDRDVGIIVIAVLATVLLIVLL